MIELATATGIAPDVWAGEGARSIVTALDVMEKRAEEAKRKK